MVPVAAQWTSSQHLDGAAVTRASRQHGEASPFFSRHLKCRCRHSHDFQCASLTTWVQESLPDWFLWEIRASKHTAHSSILKPAPWWALLASWLHWVEGPQGHSLMGTQPSAPSASSRWGWWRDLDQHLGPVQLSCHLLFWSCLAFLSLILAWTPLTSVLFLYHKMD